MANATTKTAPNGSTASLQASGFFKPIIDKCIGCERIVEANAQKICASFAIPEAKWRLGLCNFATHAKQEIVATTTKVNPLKASKRAMAGKKK